MTEYINIHLFVNQALDPVKFCIREPESMLVLWTS